MLAVGLFTLIAPGHASAAPTPPPAQEILELRDEKLIARIWEALHPDSAAPPGEYQMLLPPPPALELPGAAPDAGAFLLRNGTMEGRLDRGAWEQAAAHSRDEKVVTWQEDWEEPLSHDIPTIWEALRADLPQLLEWTAWPAGVEIGWSSSMGSVARANPQIIQQLDFRWTQKPFRHLLVAGGIHRTLYGGGLVRRDRLQNMETASFFSPEVDTPGFWTDPYWWWSLSAGVPGVKYTLSLADRPLPAYFWLEGRASTLIQERRRGRVVTQWTDRSLAAPQNLAHGLDVRFAHARYRLHWDGDAYSAAIHAFELDELPAFIGHWGVGLLAVADVAATRAWLDIADFGFSVGRPTAWPTRVRLAFLRLEMAYRNVKNYQLGASLNVRLDNPILNLPGGLK